MNTKYKHSDITEEIIKAAYKVYNTLGFGFLEKVYENALILEMKKSGLNVKKQEPINVFYEDGIIGEYVADIVVAGKVIVEVKAIKNIDEIHEVQLINYLKATKIEVGLLINFGREIEIKRKIFDL